jgi:hypothetical protein
MIDSLSDGVSDRLEAYPSGIEEISEMTGHRVRHVGLGNVQEMTSTHPSPRRGRGQGEGVGNAAVITWAILGHTALAVLVLVTTWAAAGESAPAEYLVWHGGDNSDGLSEKTAFSSIGKGINLLKPGDTLTILPGTYFESVSARISGTPAAPIVIRAKRPGTVLLRGDVDAPRFLPVEGRPFTFYADFEKRVEGVAERSTLRIYEPMLSLAEVELSPASFYQDSQSRRLYVHTSDSAHPDFHALSVSVTNGFGILLTPPPGSVFGGSDHVIRRCFYDGRETSGYVGSFVRASGTSRLSVENCVMINGMGEGVVLYNCPEVSVRNCVFYNNFIRAMTAWNFEPSAIVALSHNLFCDTIPAKTGNAFIRLNHLENLRSDHNAYFARKGPAERRLVETAKIGGQAVGVQMPGTYRGADLLLADVQQQARQEKASVFGNPGIRVVKELLPSGAPEGEWRRVEMHWDGQTFRPWDFADFLTDPASPLARAADEKPRGLDPAAFP